MTNMETKLSDLELITSVLIEATKNVEEIYFQLPVAGQKPYVSDKMMPHLFERIAPPWAQSEMTITLSLGEFAGRKYDACAISTQLENEVHSANVVRRDQRAFRHCFTRARRGRKWKKRSRVCFRQRHGGGRCIPAPFQPSLRLHFTFPPAEPPTEACR